MKEILDKNYDTNGANKICDLRDVKETDQAHNEEKSEIGYLENDEEDEEDPGKFQLMILSKARRPKYNLLIDADVIKESADIELLGLVIHNTEF